MTNLKELESELFELKSRANRVGYKNIIPRLPYHKADHLMIGFYKRLHNWKNGLLQFENPGGIKRENKIEYIDASNVIFTDAHIKMLHNVHSNILNFENSDNLT